MSSQEQTTRPYADWAKNQTIKKTTSQGLKNSDQEMQSEEILKHEKKQRNRFNEWLSSWTDRQKSAQ